MIKPKRTRVNQKTITPPPGMRAITDEELNAWIVHKDPMQIQLGKMLITRTQIQVLADVGWTKVNTAIRIRSAKFPKFICHVRRFTCAFRMSEVVDWLAKNDLKTMSFTKTDYANASKSSQAKIAFDNALAAQFMIGKQPPYSTILKKTTVRLQERNDYVPPHSGLMLSGSADFSHRITAAGSWY